MKGIFMQCKRCKADLLPKSSFCHICGMKQAPSKRNVKKRGNGQGSAFKRGKTWTAWLESRAGGIRTVRTKGGFPTRKEALDYIDMLKKPRKASLLSDLWTLYEDNALTKLSASKQTAYKIAYRRMDDIKLRRISELSIEPLQSCVNNNATSYYTARDMKIVLSHLYKMAMAQQEVSVNLSQFLVLPDLNEAEPNPFTEDELKRLWNHYESDRWIGYILLMVYSGMMPGELFICKKSMIDIAAQTITGCGLKTKQRKKTPLMVADIIVPVVQELLALNDSDVLLAMKKNDFYDRFDKTLRYAGCRDLTPYACRHTTATALALGNKVAPSVIKKIMRHSNISTTQRYIHPDTRAMLDAVNTFSRE